MLPEPITPTPPTGTSQSAQDFGYRFNLIIPWVAFFILVGIQIAAVFSNLPNERVSLLSSLLNLGTGSALTYMRPKQ